MTKVSLKYYKASLRDRFLQGLPKNPKLENGLLKINHQILYLCDW